MRVARRTKAALEYNLLQNKFGLPPRDSTKLDRFSQCLTASRTIIEISLLIDLLLVIFCYKRTSLDAKLDAIYISRSIRAWVSREERSKASSELQVPG